MDKIKKLFKKNKQHDKERHESIVTEIEEQVAGPWREFESGGDWSGRFHERLLETIQQHETEEEGIERIRILLLGQVKAGKSSFINTVATIDRKRMAQVTRAGAADGSLTNELKEYRPREALKKICILDTMGLETNMSGLNVKDVLHLVNGNVCPGYKFNPASSITKKRDEYRSDPKRCDKVNCVVYVVDANILGQDNVSGETKQILKDVHAELSSQDVATFVLLTKIDVLCQSVATNVINTYTSEKVKQAVNLAEELYKVPKQNIFPVKNYEHESGRNLNAEILILLALKQMVNFGTDFLNHTTGSSSKF